MSLTLQLSPHAPKLKHEQAQAHAGVIAVARTITCLHASTSSTNATKRVITSQCAAAKFLNGQTSGEEKDEEETLGTFHISTPVKASKETWATIMVIHQVPVRIEIDTSSGKNLTGKDTWKQRFPKKKLRETPVNLMMYSDKKLPLLHTCLAEVQHHGERHCLELLVAVMNQPPIISCVWLSKIKIDWKGVFHIKSRTLQQVLDKHEAVFEKGLGAMKAKLHLKSGATPKFIKAQPVPFALRPKVEVSLKKLKQEGMWVVSGDHVSSLSPRKPEA